MTEESCKGCRESVMVTDDQLRRMLSSLSKHSDSVVDDVTYERRLAHCERCPSLVYGSTCMHCGCIVALRAKLKEKNCPYPGSPKW